MLIPVWFYKGLFYGSLGAALVSVLYYAYRPKHAPSSDRIPRAEIAKSRARQLLPWLPRIGLIGGLALAWFLNHIEHGVVMVTDGDDGPTARRMKYLGTPDYPYAPGEKKPDYVFSFDEYVVNHSSRPVRIELFSDGRDSLGFGGAAKPTIIPPGTSVITSGIEYIGPNDHPPEELHVEGVEAKMGQTSRSWLTWDR